VSGGAGGGVGWGFVEGGMGTVTRLMADAAGEAGAVIRTGAPGAQLKTRAGRAVGLALEDGEELRARVVVSNADPKRTFLGLVAESDLPASFVARMRACKTDGGRMKMQHRGGDSS